MIDATTILIAFVSFCVCWCIGCALTDLRRRAREENVVYVVCREPRWRAVIEREESAN